MCWQQLSGECYITACVQRLCVPKGSATVHHVIPENSIYTWAAARNGKNKSLLAGDAQEHTHSQAELKQAHMICCQSTLELTFYVQPECFCRHTHTHIHINPDCRRDSTVTVVCILTRRSVILLLKCAWLMYDKLTQAHAGIALGTATCPVLLSQDATFSDQWDEGK